MKLYLLNQVEKLVKESKICETCKVEILKLVLALDDKEYKEVEEALGRIEGYDVEEINGDEDYEFSLGDSKVKENLGN